MARQFASGGGYALVSASMPTSASTLAVWFQNTGSPSGGFTLVGCGNTAGGSTYYGLGITKSGSTYTFNAFSNPNGSGETDANTGPTLSASTWYHGCATFGGGSMRCYTNGANAILASIGLPGSVNTGTIGALDLGGSIVSRPSVAVYLAEVAVWSVALSAGEVGSLAAGVPPWMIRPTSLFAYWPLYGLHSPEPDLSGSGRSMTLNSSPPSVAQGPPMSLFWPPNAMSLDSQIIPPLPPPVLVARTRGHHQAWGYSY